jgi:hypothetical protein
LRRFSRCDQPFREASGMSPALTPFFNGIVQSPAPDLMPIDTPDRSALIGPGWGRENAPGTAEVTGFLPSKARLFSSQPEAATRQLRVARFQASPSSRPGRRSPQAPVLSISFEHLRPAASPSRLTA